MIQLEINSLNCTNSSKPSLETADESWISYGLRKIFDAIGSLFSQSKAAPPSLQKSRAPAKIHDDQQEESPGYIVQAGISQLFVQRNGNTMLLTIYDPDTGQGIGQANEMNILENYKIVDQIDEE